MKQILLITLVALTTVSYAQTYHTLSECGNDPLIYIEKNYQDNAAAYVGKTIGYWADQCELDLNNYYFIPAEYSPWGINNSLKGTVESLDFKIPYKDGLEKYVYYIYISIDDSTPINWRTAVDLEGDYDEPWGTKYYNFYKNAKIKKIDVGKKINGVYNNDYRRPPLLQKDF